MVTVAGVNDMQLITKPLLAELAPQGHAADLPTRCGSTPCFEDASQCGPRPITRLLENDSRSGPRGQSH
jgi:hypothetical protein